MAEANDDFISALRGLVQSEQANINTAIDGVIVSYADGFATVRPVGTKLFPDGDTLPFPEIYKVPVRWQTFAGGQAGFKGPVTAGDKCLLVFGQQATDGTDDMRRFDLSDAYAIPIDNQQSQDPTSNASMVMYFGSSYIAINADGSIDIKSTGAIRTVAPNGTTTTAPTNVFTGNINGQGGFDVTGGTSGTANITGNVNIVGTVTNNGKNIGSTHTHSGVQTGSGSTGAVN